MARNRFIAMLILGAMLTVAPVAVASTPCEPAGSQEHAVARSGHIPGLGKVAGTIGWDNRKQLTLSGAGFTVTRTITPEGDVEIRISGPGESDPLVVRIDRRDGLSVVRGQNVVWGTFNASSLRAITDSPSVSAFREHIGEYERRLLGGAGVSRLDDPHAYGFLLAGAFVASLSGDPVAVGRARDVVMRRIRGHVRAARDEFRNCVVEYERYLLMIDTNRTTCLEAANGHDSWYERSAQRLLCEAEFMAGALSGEGQFISCTALLPLAKG